MSIKEDIAEILVDEVELRWIIPRLAGEIRRDYKGIISKNNPLLLVVILRGAFIFAADLARILADLPIEVDFMAITSYDTGATESSGVVQILQDLRINIQGRHVLIVEDIIDTGYSLDYLKRILSERRPASLKVCVLLNKKERREIEVRLDYVGKEIPNKYVVGEGLDGSDKDGRFELYRNLPFVGVLKKDI